MKKTIGLIINPIAGMGGPLGLKGSDGESAKALIRQSGAVGRSGIRMQEALSILNTKDVRFVTCKADMGESLFQHFPSYDVTILDIGGSGTTSADTCNAVSAMLTKGVDLLIFAGGDGTARDIVSVCGHNVPILGVPAGVKMHSAVFAKNPQSGGRLIDAWISGDLTRTELVEIVDLDEDLYRKGIVSPKLYATAKVLYDHRGLQCKKTATQKNDQSAQADVAWEMINRMEHGLYLLGPGTTTYEIGKQLALQTTLIGFDAIYEKKVIRKDLNELDILKLSDQHVLRCILTPVGGQGFLLGRGNQQMSPRVIRRIRPENMFVIATQTKLSQLNGNPLLVDTGDYELDLQLSGFKRVITGLKTECVYPISRG